MITSSKVFDDALDITCNFDATVDQVWAAWTDPGQMVQWMGPGTVRCVNVEVNLKVGGSYRIHMKGEEGDHIAYGEYMEIEPNKKLVMTWQWEDGTFEGSILTVLFSATASGTAININHAKFPNRDQALAHSEGWSGSLEKFSGFCETLKTPV